METTTDDLPALVPVPVLAKRWHTTKAGIHHHRTRGTCPPALKIGGRLLFRREDVLAYEAAQAVTQLGGSAA